MAHLTYLIYIVFWESFILGGCAYLVFIQGIDARWFFLAVFLSMSAYRPKTWMGFFKEDKTKEST